MNKLSALIRLIALICPIIAVPNWSFGAEAPLQLDELLHSIAERHPLLAATSEERKLAEADLLSAEGAFDPSVKGEVSSYGTGYYTGNRSDLYLDVPVATSGARFFGGYRASGGIFPSYEDQYDTNEGGELRAGFELPLLRDGAIDRRRASISRSKLQQLIAETNIDARKIELLRLGKIAYWEWVANGRRHEIARSLVEVAKQRERQLRERVKRGDLPEFDFLDNQRAVLQRESQLFTAERALQGSAFELSLFFRDQHGAQIVVSRERLPQQLPEPIVEQVEEEQKLVEQAYRARPEIRRIDAARDQNTIERTLAQNQILPRLDFSAIASQDLGDGAQRREEGEIKAGVKLEIPILTRTAEGRIQFAEAKEREFKEQQRFVKERIVTDIRDSRMAIAIAMKRIKVARAELVAAQSLESGERNRFDLGDSNLIFVNLREQTSAEAAGRVVDALLDYHRAQANFQAALGRDASADRG